MFNKKGVYLSLLLITLLGSCKNYEYEVSEPLIPYVDEYLQILKDNDISFRKQDFTVLFDEGLVGTNYVGYAIGMFNKKTVKVSINPFFWKSLNNKQRKILIFHELSHDLFDSMHTKDVFFMQPVIHNRFIANTINWDLAVSELVKYIKDAR